MPEIVESKVLDSHQFTNSNKGAKNDPRPENRYLIAADAPELRQKPTDNAGFKLTEVAKCSDGVTLPAAFQAHLVERRDKRAKTNVLRAQLACMLVSVVSTDMLRNFMARMHSDGRGGSKAPKEMALLKHAFNVAVRE